MTRERGYHLLYTNIENDLRIETEQLSRLKNQRVAGIILFPLATKGEPEILQDLICTIPTVLVDRELDEFCGSVVLSDNFNAAYQGVQYLLNQGHSRIACVSHLSDASSVIERIRGYQQAMRDAGRLPYATIKLLDCGAYPPGEIPEYAAEELIEIDHALSVPERPTAVFCINDYIAIGVMRLALSKGLCVPKDLSVLGFDNSVFAQLAPVPLSSIEQQEVEIGARACEMLLDKIANPDAAPQKILLPTRLILRASTAKE